MTYEFADGSVVAFNQWQSYSITVVKRQELSNGGYDNLWKEIKILPCITLEMD